mmetsp:Transcript_4028/g.7582  ORF Transcript_4028/g.7582 Transcript_4028/m.7582 type:complete len:256 (-) Transcript_4028:324-1091(-)
MSANKSSMSSSLHSSISSSLAHTWSVSPMPCVFSTPVSSSSISLSLALTWSVSPKPCVSSTPVASSSISLSFMPSWSCSANFKLPTYSSKQLPWSVRPGAPKAASRRDPAASVASISSRANEFVKFPNRAKVTMSVASTAVATPQEQVCFGGAVNFSAARRLVCTFKRHACCRLFLCFARPPTALAQSWLTLSFQLHVPSSFFAVSFATSSAAAFGFLCSPALCLALCTSAGSDSSTPTSSSSSSSSASSANTLW